MGGPSFLSIQCIGVLVGSVERAIQSIGRHATFPMFRLIYALFCQRQTAFEYKRMGNNHTFDTAYRLSVGSIEQAIQNIGRHATFPMFRLIYGLVGKNDPDESMCGRETPSLSMPCIVVSSVVWNKR